ncbi:MAG TPA: sigma-70 family RNA polymerase sigma factor [Sunxiuqinia sp.]|nr:sigma-70 family RNA polymerase sigma factor [Sunxiuqinia sp.]
MKSTKEEFLELLSNYQGILHKVCLVYFKNESDRKDNFQEIVYQLWRSFPKLQDKGSIGSWMYAVAINTSISMLRKNSRVDFRETIPEFSDQSTVFDKIVTDERLRLLLNAIHQLDEVDKSIMLLYLEEKRYEEIAKIIGLTKSNVGVRINRAKKQLQQHLKNH